MSLLLYFLLLISVDSVAAEVILHDVGKLTVVVEDDQLHVIVLDHEKCDGDIEIHYGVTKVRSAAFAVSGDEKLCRLRNTGGALILMGFNVRSNCPLAKSNGNRLNINAVALPKDCVVALKNAELPSAASNKTKIKSLHTAVIIGAVFGSFVLIGLAIAIFVWTIGRRCWKRQVRKRKPMEGSVNEPPPLLKASEATKTHNQNGKKNRKSSESNVTKTTPAEMSADRQQEKRMDKKRSITTMTSKSSVT